jgi:heptosyltransferase I
MLCYIGRIGDTILRNSILDSALRTYATVDYICGSHNAECVRSDSRLNRVIVYQSSPAGLMGVLKAALRRRYDAFIDLKDPASSTSLIIARLSRSLSKTGCNGKYLRPFHQNVQSIQDPHTHTVERMRRIGQLTGLQTGEYKPSLIVALSSIAWFRSNYACNRPFIFLNLSATHANRLWPVRSWARYVRGCGLADQTIFINGLPEHQEMVHQLCKELPGAIAFQPRCFMDVAAAVADARLVLTVDTGVVHVCSALDKPVVAFFQSTRGVVGNAPLSTRHLMIRPQSGIFVQDIDPEQAITETLHHGLP